jgi:transporter family-2 protein
MGILVTASVCACIVLDHSGLVGFQEHAASWGRIAGAALMIAGVWLVATL